MHSHFAPAERAEPEDFNKQLDIASNSEILIGIEQAIDGYLMILNAQRQVIEVNVTLLKNLGVEDPELIIGQRPGEIFNCINSKIEPGGCGTSEFCSSCGAVVSILLSQEKNEPIENECKLSFRVESHTNCLELRVRATPIFVEKTKLTIFVINNISDEKRKEALEHVFFHDILNTIGGLMGWSDLLAEAGEEVAENAVGRIRKLSSRLNDEVQNQQNLILAENGSYVANKTDIEVSEIFQELKDIFSEHQAAKDKKLEINTESDIVINTDNSLISRILINMAKNAFEASKDGDTVKVWLDSTDTHNIFNVWNPGVIPPDVASQIFKRSFSTKSNIGRGIGTYSMKLFGERYLDGEIDFKTGDKEGTTFFIKLPK